MWKYTGTRITNTFKNKSWVVWIRLPDFKTQSKSLLRLCLFVQTSFSSILTSSSFIKICFGENCCWTVFPGSWWFLCICGSGLLFLDSFLRLYFLILDLFCCFLFSSLRTAITYILYYNFIYLIVDHLYPELSFWSHFLFSYSFKIIAAAFFSCFILLYSAVHSSFSQV